MKQHKKLWDTVIALVVIVIGVFGYRGYARHANAHRYINSSTPSVFVHGWGSSYRAETQMANAAKNAGASNSIIRADVSKNGKVKLIGTIKKNAQNPIVEVNLENNKSANYKKPNDPEYVAEYHRSGIYIKNVVLALQKRYHVKKINFVGHSMGNLLIAYYLADNANNKRLPQLEHQVVIAGHYNGLTMEDPRSMKSKVNSKTGKPSIMLPEYKGILSLRQTYPKTAKVMNIYGDIKDGSHSDSQVPVNSAKSYKYLVGNRANSYVEHEITGKSGKHGNLHENKQVDQYLINFLWSKAQN
ncbi:alpha/beta hydrolase [uncultured Limosilactobacillus sp.]|uniref:alpha/beta hydrolase n=1 Tax=uncultured Limosilactobacillus sp. TaxID=2837629 RepID=UPI0025DED310|nr:alpha/beta hydrolase [uncultured Limosilactobacillus sp.]